MGSINSFPLGLEIFTVSTDILDFKTVKENVCRKSKNKPEEVEAFPFSFPFT